MTFCMEIKLFKILTYTKVSSLTLTQQKSKTYRFDLMQPSCSSHVLCLVRVSASLMHPASVPIARPVAGSVSVASGANYKVSWIIFIIRLTSYRTFIAIFRTSGCFYSCLLNRDTNVNVRVDIVRWNNARRVWTTEAVREHAQPCCYMMHLGDVTIVFRVGKVIRNRRSSRGDWHCTG